MGRPGALLNSDSTELSAPAEPLKNRSMNRNRHVRAGRARYQSRNALKLFERKAAKKSARRVVPRARNPRIEGRDTRNEGRGAGGSHYRQ